ncbi:MAG: TonB-dependent receptor [Nitrospinaceae bacterium]|nr:MAG: TonB-dependent receptor [Nitrospinaceae bacterium]
MIFQEKVSVRAFVVYAILNLICVQPALADEGDNDRLVMPEVLVEAPKATLKETTQTSIGTFESTVGTLTVPSNLEAAKIIQRTPGGVAVVDSKAFENDFSLNFEDTLAFVPGVFATKRFAEEVRISIRGSGLERNFHQKGLAALQDGVPFNAADGSGDFQEIDNLTLQRIEVFKGGNSMQFGGTTLGGSINMISKTGQSHPGHQLRLEGGSDDTFRGNFQTGQLFGNSDLFLSFTGSMSDGFRQHADQESYKFNSNLGTRLSETVETRFYFTANYVELELPGTVTLSSALNNPRVARDAVLAADEHRDINSVRASNKTTFDLGGGNLLDVGAFFTYKDLFHPITPFVGVIDQESHNYGVFARGTGSYNVGEFLNRFSLGVTTHTGKTDAKVFANVGGQRGALTRDTDQLANSVVVYGENSFYITRNLALITGLQYVWANRDVVTASDTYESVNPKVGVLYEPSKTMQFFANVSKSYEPPDFSDLTQGGTSAFVPLDAQRAWTAEVGTRGQRGPVAWDVSVYRAWIFDELLKFTVGGGIPATTFNADETIHQGVEAGLTVQLAENLIAGGDRLGWRNSYTYSDFRFDGDALFGNNTIPGQPPHLFQTELRYDHREGWYVAVNADKASKAEVDFTNTFTAPGYTLMGFGAGYEVNKNVSMFVTGRNLFDTNYISNFSTAVTAGTGSALFYPGDGRRFFGGVTLRF